MVDRLGDSCRIDALTDSGGGDTVAPLKATAVTRKNRLSPGYPLILTRGFRDITTTRDYNSLTSLVPQSPLTVTISHALYFTMLSHR